MLGLEGEKTKRKKQTLLIKAARNPGSVWLAVLHCVARDEGGSNVHSSRSLNSYDSIAYILCREIVIPPNPKLRVERQG